jgi:formylglycine-generating enzyme required for sulfatase activity
MRRVSLLLVLLTLALAATASAQTTNPQHNVREFRDCADCPEMVTVPAGRFLMGSPAGEPGRFDAEGPQHAVTVRAFALGKYDVTNEEFLTFLRETGYQPAPCDPVLGVTWRSPGRGLAYSPVAAEPPRWPAFCLNWFDAEAYIAWLNARVRRAGAATASGDGPYRLPSEAEWEYAARAATATARWWGDAVGTGNANCNGCGSHWDGHEMAPVGSFRPNGFGLYDMLGNVWQWLADCWNESYVGAPGDGSAWQAGDCSKRVLRGGSWSNLPEFIRSAARSRADAAGRDADYSSYAGFRVARSLP